MTDEEIVRWYLDKVDDRAGWEALVRMAVELKELRAERDAALKLVDDTLEAVGHQHDLGLTVCSCGKLMPPRTPRTVDPGEIGTISATAKGQNA